MKKISLVINKDIALSSVSAIIDLLNGANRFCEHCGKPPAFKLNLLAERTDCLPLNLPFKTVSCNILSEVIRTDLVIIPALNVDPSIGINNIPILKNNTVIINWIKEMNTSGAEVASLCLGSYFLAEAGLLNGKAATSHWAVVDDMQKRYPLIKVKPDLIITDEDGIYTSGGAFSSLKLILYLIEKFCGRETALYVSKIYAVDMDRTSQANFAVFTGQHEHDDSAILKSQLFIEQFYKSNISIDEVAAQSCMGMRNFIRRFKAASRNTLLEYLQRVRVEAAKKGLEKNEQDIIGVMVSVGYKDLKTFREIFKRFTGFTPLAYRKKYARLADR
jgi:transcriptional regulator GlxA family with amidase domain